MFYITKLLNGKFLCECVIQDGTERWHEDTEEKAVQSLIQGARVLNGSYIRADDITWQTEVEKVPTRSITGRVISANQEKLLDDIDRGAKKVLEFDHFLLKYRITKDEAEMVVKIREGKLRVVPS